METPNRPAAHARPRDSPAQPKINYPNPPGWTVDPGLVKGVASAARTRIPLLEATVRLDTHDAHIGTVGGVTGRRVSYLLVGNPRTGSSLLADALRETGRLGRPEEYFWREQEQVWATRFGLPTPNESTYSDYVEAALAHGRTPNGVFAAKVFWVHAEDLIRHAASIPELASLPAHLRLKHIFGDDVRAILLRRNCLRSAISLWRAEVTGVWRLGPGESASPAPSAVDVWRVTQLHAVMHAADIAWPNLLTSADIDYLTLTYRDLANLRDCVQQVADFVGVVLTDTNAVSPPSSRRQADTATERFIREWCDATGGCTTCQDGHAG